MFHPTIGNLISHTSPDDDEPVSTTRNLRTPRSYKVIALSSSEDEAVFPNSSSHKRTPESSLLVVTSHKKSQATPKRPPNARSFLLGGSSGNAPIAKSRQRSSRVTPVKRSSKRRHSSSDTDTDDDSLIEELEIEAPASSPIGRRRMLRRSTRTAPALSGDDGSEENGPLGQLSKNEIQIPRRLDRNQKMDRKGTVSNDHDSDNDSDNDMVDSSIEHNRGNKRAFSNSEGEVSDLEQDADYLRDTGNTDVTSYFECYMLISTRASGH